MSHLYLLIAAVVVICAVLFYYYRPAIPGLSAAVPATVDQLSNRPANIKLESGDKIPYVAGQKWPNPASAGCTGNLNYGLITSTCPAGKVSGLVNGGAMKCTNQQNTSWSTCRQAAN